MTTKKAQVENELLRFIHENGTIEDTFEYDRENHEMVIGTVKSLMVDAFVDSSDLSTSFYVLTEEGKFVQKHGSPEYRMMEVLKGNEECDLKMVEDNIGKDLIKAAMGQCMKNKWISFDKKNNTVRKKVDNVKDEVAELLSNLDQLNEAEYKLLKRRKMIALQVRRSLKVWKGKNFALERKKHAAGLTKEMMEKGEWKSTVFKPYNFKTLGLPVGGGHLHPLMKVRTEFRRVLMDMGFSEMPTNRYVESSFWNFDALFQPQSHPARDAHDTFFLTAPESCNTVPEEYYERVKTMHEDGGHGSIGHGRGAFTRKEATKNLLRTHTTAVSARMLYKLANQPGGFQPQKYFSIDRVFRNESMDATHLAEFHQVEGVIADYNLSLGDLIGVISRFFEKIGMTNIRFKPAYNPYTEPSMEIFAFHPDLNKWTEVGNSGVFRPEMLLPMGLPSDVRVIAWGLSLERPTMIKYRLNNIRDLFGHKVDLEQTKSAKLYRI